MSGAETPSSDSLNFRQSTLDGLSASFCGAKWYDSTIWLNSGLTASCHHTPAHAISREALKTDPSALHNTDHKKSMRRLMQKGLQPEECEYCWKLESMGEDAISDRVLKTQRLALSDLKVAREQSWQTPVAPRFLEIAFDRICQFACMYCSPSFSTTWERDVGLGGGYKDLRTDFEEHYISTHESVKLEDKGAEFVEAFWRWWPELVHSLKTLRVTGGEPLLSPHFWALIARKDLREKRVQLAVNTNLGVSAERIGEFLTALDGCQPVEIFTSGEAFGAAGEYVRDGLVWADWTNNVETVLQSKNIKNVCISFSINAVAVFSVLPMMDYVMALRERHGRKRVKLFWNIVRYPRFQSLSVLPTALRREVGAEITAWLAANSSLLEEFERHSVERFLQYLTLEDGPTVQTENVAALQKDLKNFIVQYDRRRKKNYRKSLSMPVVEWLDSLESSHDLL